MRFAKCRALVADPGWKFDDNLPDAKTAKRGATKLYTTMPVDDICQMQLPPVADDAYLFLWRVGQLQKEAFQVGEAWGFRYASELVWIKQTSKGARFFGMGRTTRAEHEVCLIFKRGNITPKSRSVRSTFTAPVGVHSQKPDVFYEIVKELTDGPYTEMFARMVRPGWQQTGNQLGVEIQKPKRGRQPVENPGSQAIVMGESETD